MGSFPEPLHSDSDCAVKSLSDKRKSETGKPQSIPISGSNGLIANSSLGQYGEVTK
jgi:hypothetical protein